MTQKVAEHVPEQPGLETSTSLSSFNTTEPLEQITVVTCSNLGIAYNRMTKSQAESKIGAVLGRWKGKDCRAEGGFVLRGG